MDGVENSRSAGVCYKWLRVVDMECMLEMRQDGRY